MRKPIPLIICLLFSTIVYAGVESDSIFKVMYETLEQRDFYVKQKEGKIEVLKNMLSTPGIEPKQQYEVNRALYQEYRSFITDSAIMYAHKNLLIAGQLRNTAWQAETQLRLVDLYSVAGMYIDAFRLLSHFDKNMLPDSLLSDYYEVCQSFYDQYTYGNIDAVLYREKKSLYRDSLLTTLSPTTNHYKIVYAEKLYDNQQLDEAKTLLLNIFDKYSGDTHEKAIVAYCIARIYKDEKDYENARKYCACSVIADTKNAIKENASLRMMANLFYDEGNIKMASQFITFSLEDATFCNARFRAVELSDIFPIIDGAYKALIIGQKKALSKYLISICILAFFLVVAIVYGYKQLKLIKASRQKLSKFNKELTTLNAELQTINRQLKTANQSLAEANRVKEEYIGHFFNLCSSYIDKLEDYRRSLNKVAAKQKVEDLYRSLKSTEFLQKELKSLYDLFDKVFIGLYPDFVREINELLLPAEQFVPKHNELLPPELRVYALIRLGITDNSQIAAFLRYSMSTIYNYRTKVRNKAAVPRDQFEEMVMNTGMKNSL